MVKFIVLSLFLFSTLFSNSIDYELQNILGQNSYQSQKKFLKILYKNERNFYTGSNVDIHKILNTLDKNSLLSLNLRRTQDLHISFATEQNNPLIFIKLIRDSLNALGYSHISSQKVMRDSSGFLWKVTIKATSAIDPVLFGKELSKRNCYYTKIKRYSKTNWRYNINIRDVDILVEEVAFNKKIKLKKPLTPYWLYIQRAKTLVLNSSRSNSWHPYIVFYDKNLKIIDIVTNQRKSYNEKLKIPQDAKYVKISDQFTLENIKRGLNIYISK